MYKGNTPIIKRYKGTQVVYNYIPEDTGTTTYAEDALVFEFTGDTLTYKLNNGTSYTATTSPTIVNLSDLGYDANTRFMFYNLFNNQTNLTKVLHFPKITGTNNPGYALFGSCKNVEYIDLSNIGNLNELYYFFNNCTSLKNLILDDVDLSNHSTNNNGAFRNVSNDIQISMNGCNCESIVTVKQALNDAGIDTYNNNVVTNNKCTFEPYETIEYEVRFNDFREWETYNKELKADSISMIETICNEDGVIKLTENYITDKVSYSYEQFEEFGENKIKCTIYYEGKNIYELTYRGTLPNTNTSACALSCDTDKTIPMQKFYINWYEGIDQPGYHFIGFSTSKNEYGDCYDCDWSGPNICPSENSYRKPNGEEGMISDLPMENGYYVLDMGETVYFKCGERNALFDHIFYCAPNIVTENTISFKYYIDNFQTKANVKLNGVTYNFDATNGEYLGDNFYKATITPDEKITSFAFPSGNVRELYAIPNNPESLNSAFQNCSSLFVNNLSGLDTSNLYDVTLTFANIKTFTEPTIVIDVSGWDISNIREFQMMFAYSNGIKTLILGEVDKNTYYWWYDRLTEAGIENQVTIEYKIIE